MNFLVEQAAAFAVLCHFDQKRKYTGEPYFVHCEEVAKLVESVGGTKEMIAAAYLHDVVEDCGITLDEITDGFGSMVSEYVFWLSDVSKPSDGNRAARKDIDRQHIAKAPPEAKTIKLADLISNSKSISKHDPNFAKVYLEEKRKLLKVLAEGNSRLYAEALRYSSSE